MDFEFTDEQTLLRHSVQRLLANEYVFQRRQELLQTPYGHSPQIWRLLADQGVLGAGLGERHGGFGGPVETMIVMEEMGRALVLEPYVSTVVVCGGLIRDLGSQTQQTRWLPGIVTGGCRGALAHHEADARYNLSHVSANARRGPDGYLLTGSKTIVEDGAVADIVVVSANDVETGGLSLFVLDSNAPGLEWIRYRTQDGRSAADLSFDDLPVQPDNLLGKPGRGLEAIEQAMDHAIAALCAEAVGAMEGVNAGTLEYLKTRRQFGQPIGRFQVLQHRMADMFLMTAQSRSMSFLATGRCQAGRAERRRALSSAKAFIGKAARFVAQQSMQLHGGMGMSAQLPISHYFKRLTLINAAWGDVDHHVGLVSELLLREASS
jgi:alkylation response protein AidB-like acyl-CoA dehydrogenase